MQQDKTLLPEWHAQEAVILAWPDAQTDWVRWLDSVRNTYLTLIKAISETGCGVILLIRPTEVASFKQMMGPADNVLLVDADYNDTWVRDYGFLTCQTEAGMQPVEFRFNGWGNKFDASKDNQVNRGALADLCALPLYSSDRVAEGGALEIDENGHLLSTELCLTNPERNGPMSLSDYRDLFADILGATAFSVLKNGHLEGDDTDGHIDTLVRFTPGKGLVIQSAFNRPDDSHFKGLKALVEECRSGFPEHAIFELPLPEIYNEEGDRLPASYANYLINNQQILCPVYGQPEDQLALEVIGKAHPSYKIVAVNSASLVQQFGSIHCISMQIPKGTLTGQTLSKLAQGVHIHG